jgi:cytochrome P450
LAIATRPLGPKGGPLRGNLPDLLRGRTDFLRQCALDYGDVVPLRFGPKRAVLLSDPVDIEDVLVARHQVFVKPYALRVDRIEFANGRAAESVAARRRQVAPAFHRKRFEAYGDKMVTSAERLLATWEDGQSRDILDDMGRVTLEIITETLFGVKVGDEAGEVGTTLSELMEAFFDRLSTMFLVPEGLPTPANRKRRRAAQRLERFVDGLIAERRASGTEGDDLLALLLQAQQAEGAGHRTDIDLREEVMTLLLAGYETTALTLTWAFFLLAEHPEVEASLTAELDRVLGDRPPTSADFPLLVQTERIVLETMRLYPPLWVMARVATEACEIGGVRLEEGTIVLVSQWVVQRDPRFFDRPDVFDPDRWADGLAARLPRYAFFPFGGGPRVCIGRSLAMMEAVLVLATVAQRYRLSLAPGRPVVAQPSITLGPERGTPLVLHRRQRAATRLAG